MSSVLANCPYPSNYITYLLGKNYCLKFCSVWMKSSRNRYNVMSDVYMWIFWQVPYTIIYLYSWSWYLHTSVISIYHVFYRQHHVTPSVQIRQFARTHHVVTFYHYAHIYVYIIIITVQTPLKCPVSSIRWILYDRISTLGSLKVSARTLLRSAVPFSSNTDPETLNWNYSWPRASSTVSTLPTFLLFNSFHIDSGAAVSCATRWAALVSCASDGEAAVERLLRHRHPLPTTREGDDWPGGSA